MGLRRGPAYAVGVRDAGDWEAAMGSTDRHGIRRSTGAVVAFAAMAASIVVACGPEPFVDDGTTFGPSESFDIESGTHAISWSAWDAVPPIDGCLFGLLLDPEDPGGADVPRPPPGFSIPKLAYQVLDGGDALNGQAVLELPSGRYRFVVEGSCSWSVRVDRH
jgi:hypothetical protein